MDFPINNSVRIEAYERTILELGFFVIEPADPPQTRLMPIYTFIITAHYPTKEIKIEQPLSLIDVMYHDDKVTYVVQCDSDKWIGDGYDLFPETIISTSRSTIPRDYAETMIATVGNNIGINLMNSALLVINNHRPVIDMMTCLN